MSWLLVASGWRLIAADRSRMSLSGTRPDLPSTAEREEIRKLRAENFELRRANEILKSASVFFAKERVRAMPK